MLFFSPTFFGNKLVLKKEIKTHKRLKWTLFNRTRHKRRRKHWKQKKTWPTISICPPRDCPTSTDQNFEAGDVAQWLVRRNSNPKTLGSIPCWGRVKGSLCPSELTAATSIRKKDRVLNYNESPLLWSFINLNGQLSDVGVARPPGRPLWRSEVEGLGPGRPTLHYQVGYLK